MVILQRVRESEWHCGIMTEAQLSFEEGTTMTEIVGVDSNILKDAELRTQICLLH